MGGALGAIGNIFSGLLGGGQKQVPQAPGQQAPAQGATAGPGAEPAPTRDPTSGLLGQMPGGLQIPPAPQPGLFDSPAVQGLLSAYLGFIGSPRRGGVGNALMQGGLGGLSAYNQAKQQAAENQYKPYLMGLQVADAQSKLADTQFKMQQLAGEQESNKNTAASIRQLAQQYSHDPQTQQELLLRADAMERSPHWIDPGKIFDDLGKRDKEQLDTQLSQMRLQNAQFEQSLEPLKLKREQLGLQSEGLGIQEKGAELSMLPGKQALQQAQLADIPTKQALQKLQLQRGQAEAAAAPIKAGETQAHIDTLLDAQLAKEHPMANVPGVWSQAQKEQWKQQRRQQLGLAPTDWQQ